MRSLIWKQWREDRVYLAIFLAWMTLAVVYCIGYESGYRFRAIVGQFSGWASLYAMVAAIVFAMRASQGENADGTLMFTRSLPIPLRHVAAVKIVGAMITLAVPILMASLLISLAMASGVVEQAMPRGDGPLPRLPERPSALLPIALGQLGSVAMIAILGGIELFLVLSLAGSWLRSKSQVGLLGAVAGFGSLIAAGLLWYGERKPYMQLAYGAMLPQSLVVQWGYGAENGGSYTDHELAHYRWWSMSLAVPLFAVLAGLFVTQYGRVQRFESAMGTRTRRLALPAVWSHLPMRLPGRWSAMLWLELRQSLPLAGFGLLFAVLIALASVLIEPQGSSSLADAARAEMPHTAAFVGMLWAAVVGSGLYAAELGEGLGSFWRSRPISPAMWFWCKFVVGLAAVLLVLDGVTILVTWQSPRDTMTTGMSWAYIGCFPILHALIYSLAVLGTCWLRKPVIGGFLAILGFSVLTITITSFPRTLRLEPINVFNQLLMAERSGLRDFTQHDYPLVYGILAASTLVFAWLASRLARPLQPSTKWSASLATIPS